jgi:hypothetical protein
MTNKKSTTSEFASHFLTSNVILGHSGNLGSEFLKFYGASNEAIPIDRRMTKSWILEGSISEIRCHLAQIRKNTEKLNLFICTGTIDPKDESGVYLVNDLFPRKIVTACEELDVSVITFGTVQEGWDLNNHYINSKRQFSEWLEQKKPTHVYNFKLHTLYGGYRTDNNLFLSQIVRSIKSGSKFRMSSGFQIREYHLQSQVTEYVNYFLRSGALDFPKHISHGKPITLRNLAEYIFDRFSLDQLLEFDDSINIRDDNFSKVYDASIPGHFIPDASLASIGDWIERRLHEEL